MESSIVNLCIIGVLLPSGSNTYWPQNDFEAVNYLFRFGYLDPNYGWSSGRNMAKLALNEAIETFQYISGKQITGKLDNDTFKMMRRKRCGVPDISTPFSPRRQKRYSLQGTRWNHTDLTYKIKSYTPDLSKTEVDNAIHRALSEWAAVSGLTFTKKVRGAVDIAIHFYSRSHEDGIPFDGPGGMLAHAFYPHDNSEGINGDAHFDEAEKWIMRSSKDENETNLYCVALHEFGHSLGLSHSYVDGAVMWPYASNCDNISLTKDDIDAIQSLYGPPKKRIQTTTKRPQTTMNTTDAKSTTTAAGEHVDGTIDGITVAIDGNTYGFKGSRIYLFEQVGIKFGFPKFIRDVFPFGPTSVDAAFTIFIGRRRQIGFTFLIKSKLVWKYSVSTQRNKIMQLLPSYPRGIAREFGVLAEKIDAAFTFSKDDRVHLVFGNTIIDLQLDNRQFKFKFLKKESVWTNRILKQLPMGSSVDAAFKWTDGHLYIFSGSKFYQTGLKKRFKLSPPDDIHSVWFGHHAIPRLHNHSKERKKKKKKHRHGKEEKKHRHGP